MAIGHVSEWHVDEGWGVITSDQTPGGAWTHFSILRPSGFGRLELGGDVTFEFEEAAQDGFAFRATSVVGFDSSSQETVDEDLKNAAISRLDIVSRGPSDRTST